MTSIPIPEQPSWLERLRRTLDCLVRDPSIPERKRVQTIIHATALTCAIVAVQPLPFADLFILTPLQLAMVLALSRAMGNPVGSRGAGEIVAYVTGVIGWGVLAQQLILGAYKTVLPFVAGLTTIPLVYAATVGLGYAALAVLGARRDDQELTKEQIRAIATEARAEAAKQQRNMNLARVQEELRELRERKEVFELFEQEFQQNSEALTEARRELDQLKQEMAEERQKLLEQIERLKEKNRDILHHRFRTCYPSIEMGEQPIEFLSTLSYKLVHAFERQVSHLEHAPDHAAFRCRIHGTDCYEIGFAKDHRLYVCRERGRLIVMRVGTKGSQSSDIAWLRLRT